jgi:hypothetical protein
MTNRHDELLCVFYALIEDAKHTFPTLEQEFDRDVDTCRTWVKARGIHLFLVDLPKVSKHLDRCLDAGEYTPSALPCSKAVSKDVVIPKFLRGLYLLVFTQAGLLREDCCTDAVFFLRQILCFGKKAPVNCSNEAYEKEVEDFVAVDSELPEPDRLWMHPGQFSGEGGVRTWKGSYATQSENVRSSGRDSGRAETSAGGNSNGSQGPDSALLMFLDRVSGIITSTLGHYDPEEWRHKHGPGAVSDRKAYDNRYKWLVWSDRLETVFPICRFGFHSYSSWASGYIDVEDREIWSKMVAVPKSYERPRLIACEPAANMWCQQNIWHYFRDRSERTWISKFCRFGDQTLNQELCRKGSADGSLATLDLSNASDSVSCRAVECLFRANPRLIQALAATRTHQVLLPNGKMHQLRKYATMGNATTFPVESLMFLSIALAATLWCRNQQPSTQSILTLIGEVAVFGDDIVVPSDSRDTVTGLLGALGFKVNVNKSYSGSNFRESCGVDSFQGVNVTPVFWKGPVTRDPDSVVRTVQVCNNFYDKMLLHTAKHLTSTLRMLPFRVATVAYRSGVFGLHSRFKPDHTGFRTRWNTDLQREEVRIPMTSSRNLRTPIEDDSALLQFFTELPDPQVSWSSGWKQRPHTRICMRWVSLTDMLTQGIH